MHHAPSVSHPVGRSFWAGAFALAVWTLGAAVCVAWAITSDATRGVQGAMALMWLVAGALAAMDWARSPRGRLQWDGVGWSWLDTSPADCTAAAPASASAMPAPDAATPPVPAPAVMLDGQIVMLVRSPAASGLPRWLWVEQRRGPGTWDDLRRALHSRATITDAGVPAP